MSDANANGGPTWEQQRYAQSFGAPAPAVEPPSSPEQVQVQAEPDLHVTIQMESTDE